MMVVSGCAGNVGVLTGWEVDALDDAELRKQVEGPEERRPADAEPSVARGRLELRRREVAIAVGDQRGDGPSRGGDPVASLADRGDDGILVDHRRMVPGSAPFVESQSQ